MSTYHVKRGDTWIPAAPLTAGPGRYPMDMADCVGIQVRVWEAGKVIVEQDCPVTCDARVPMPVPTDRVGVFTLEYEIAWKGDIRESVVQDVRVLDDDWVMPTQRPQMSDEARAVLTILRDNAGESVMIGHLSETLSMDWGHVLAAVKEIRASGIHLREPGFVHPDVMLP